MHAVIKQAMLPAIKALGMRIAMSPLLSGAMAANAPRLIPRAATLPNPQRAYVEITTDLP